MNLLEALVFNVLKAIGLVPSSGEDIERYLSTDGVGEVIFGELLLEDFYEGSTDTMDLRTSSGTARCGNRGADLVVSFELVAFRNPRT